MISRNDALSDRARGESSEERFFRLLSPPSPVPEWLLGVVPVPSQDEFGIDFYVLISGNNQIPVDVKSSWEGKRARMQEMKKSAHKVRVCIIIIREELDDDSMRKQIIAELEKWKSRHLL